MSGKAIARLRRLMLEQWIEEMIWYLDRMDGDCDLEDSDEDGDFEDFEDERELDHAEDDSPMYIWGGQGI